MGDENLQTSPRRLRNHSYKESLSGNTPLVTSKMSGKLPDLEEEETSPTLIMKEDFAKKSTMQKLDAVADAINKMYDKMNQVTKGLEEKIMPMENAVFDRENGVCNKTDQLVQNAKETESMMRSMMEENIQLRDELDVLKGVVHKLSNQITSSNQKVNQLVAKSMEDNLVFTGILEDVPKANPRKQLQEFFRNIMNLYDIRDADIFSVYRMGQSAKGKHRPIVAHCSPELRRYIMNHASILKSRKNDRDGKYYINPQLPEAISEHRREMRQIIKDQRTKEQDLPQDTKSKIVIRNDKLFVNGQLQRKKISPPQIQQLFPDEKEQKVISSIKMRFFHTQPEKGSEFKAAVLKTDSFNTLHQVYIKLFQKYPSADHIAVAAIINGEEAFHDNGEFGCGFRILRCLQNAAVQNTAVFLIRYFGGVHLGPRRFVIMTDMVSAALDKIAEQGDQAVQSPPLQSRHMEYLPSQSSGGSISSEDEEIKEEKDEHE